MSVMAARYGEARAEAVPGDTLDAMLEVERADRKELPLVCMVGDVKYWDSPASVVVGVAKTVGVSFK